jgi:hypothetical protein
MPVATVTMTVQSRALRTAANNDAYKMIMMLLCAAAPTQATLQATPLALLVTHMPLNKSALPRKIALRWHSATRTEIPQFVANLI